MDKDVELLMSNIADNFCRILGDNLVGMYIHGSVAFGCFNWNKSDIDFIAVVKTVPTKEQKTQLVRQLLQREDCAPEKGLEVSLVLENDCKGLTYPVPYCLHYSKAHRQAYIDNMSAHLELLVGTDRDLSAHFTVINHVGITFCGKEKEQVFSPVPKEHYLDSIKYDIENAVKEIAANPVYFILNLCRALAFVKDEKVMSKAGGGLWGIEKLTQYSALIQCAYDNYTSDTESIYDKKELTAFAKFMIKEIYH